MEKKMFKASVIEKETGRFTIIESEYYTKKAFIEDLRDNGYRVNPDKVKEKELYNWIVDNTNCEPIDWKRRYIGEPIEEVEKREHQKSMKKIEKLEKLYK